MNRIASVMIPQSSMLDLARAQKSLVEAARQSSEQTRETDLKGYGRQSQTLVSAGRMLARTESLRSAAEEVKTRMEIQDLALERASGVMSKLRGGLFENISLENGANVRSQLEEAFSIVRDAMNTRLGDRYLFGGVLNDRPPIIAESLDQLAANPLTSSIQQGAAPQVVRIEEGRTMNVGGVASDIATDALAAIKRLAEFDAGPSGPFGRSLTSAQSAALQNELSSLGAAFDKLLMAQAQNGRLLNDADAAIKRHEDQVQTLNQAMGGIVEVDLAEVAVRLNQAQFAYESSASVFNILKSMSLLNILK
jgi:flagellar hook-associated protein 3 FlgL